MEKLTIRRVRARPIVLKLERPVVARIATITDWPLILIDLETEEGIVGRSYLEPYITTPTATLAARNRARCGACAKRCSDAAAGT